MRVLVTGGAGYIGCLVVDELLKKDHKPVVVVNTRINQNAGHRIPDG